LRALGFLEESTVSEQSKKVFFIVFALLSVFIAYLIFNVGNPNSLLRYIIEDPSYDIIILVAFAVLLSVMSFYYAHTNETGGYEKIVQANLKKIHKLRRKGKTNEEIAQSILKAMNIRRGYRYHYAVKRLVLILEKVK